MSTPRTRKDEQEKKFKNKHVTKRGNCCRDRKRYFVEQFNSRFKEMLQGCWQKFKGLAKKATIVYSALIKMLAIALQALLQNKPELLWKIGVYRC